MVKSIAPETRVRAMVGPVQSLSWTDLDDFDAVCAATDNLTVEVELGERTHALGLAPVLFAAVHGPSLTAQVRRFLNRTSLLVTHPKELLLLGTFLAMPHLIIDPLGSHPRPWRALSRSRMHCA